MKKFKSVLFVFSTIVLGLLLFLNNDLKTYATSINNTLALHEQTKIYSSNNSDYFYGCEDYDDYVNQVPEITVLTHGLGSYAKYWSNDININSGKDFAYNSSSLIDKIYTKLNGNVLIYLAKCNNSKTFQLTQYNRYLTKICDTERLSDVSKHILLIYESFDSYASNDDVYEEFENVLDTISMQYKSITNDLPRFNLIGHSRGGITNIMYATEHPYNVAALFSLGTPYNGSVLGGIDSILDGLHFYNSNGEFYPGVQSILDYNEAIKIRDNWNEAYTEDINMNVVAYGSMVSIDFIECVVEDAVNGTSEFSSMLKPYFDLMQTVINVVRKHPNLIGGTVDFIQGLAMIANSFGINLYDEVLKNINPDLEGDITYEEGQKILGLYNVINGQAVIMDDLFIDLNSQLGFGFEDNINFNGFKRYVKIFQPEDLTSNRSIPTSPAVAHNLETMNETYTNAISGALVYGSSKSDILTLEEGKTISISVLGDRVFGFSSIYSGVHRVIADGAKISLYVFDDNNGLELLETNTNSITFDCQSEKRYWIVVSNNLKSNLSVLCDVINTLALSDNIITINKGSKCVLKFETNESGYYLISSSTKNVAIDGVINYDNLKYYFYLSTDKQKYIYLTNNASYEVTVNIYISKPENISLEEGEFVVGSSQKILRFENPYNESIQFKLNTTWTDSTTKYAYIYDENNSSISSVVTGTNKRTYSFTLAKKQSCYIIFSDIKNNVNADLVVNPLQLKWKINSSYFKTSVTLPRGKSYNIKLVLFSNNKELDYYSEWVFYQKDAFFTLSNDGELDIRYDALIGYDIVITPIISPDYLLNITIGFDNMFSYSIINDDKIQIQWNMTLYNEALQNVVFNIINGKSISTYTLECKSGIMNLLSHISDSTGTTTIEIVSISISGIIFKNGTEFFNQKNTTINNLYLGGSGTKYSPYRISCYRHLENIKKNISSYYILEKNIDMHGKGDWSPISEFRGIINGNNMCISNMKINLDKSGKKYGFVEYNYGTITNVNFSSTIINNTLSNVPDLIYIGIIAGQNEGTIEFCNVSYLDLNIQFFNFVIGGICGCNNKNINSCNVNNLTMTVSGNAGGIVGKNIGTISSCHVKNSSITYVYYNPEIPNNYSAYNGNIGGLCGYNLGTITDSSTNGNMYWYNTSDNNRDIYPSLGLLIGQNAGIYSGCSSTMYHEIKYFYWNFIGWYDQSGRCFKVDNGMVGYQPE